MKESHPVVQEIWKLIKENQKGIKELREENQKGMEGSVAFLSSEEEAQKFVENYGLFVVRAIRAPALSINKILTPAYFSCYV